jgi:hypothetical protein
MVRKHNKPCSPEQLAIVRWTAGLGAITAQALAAHADVTIASARARLTALEHVGVLSRRRVLVGQPALYTVTAAGLRAGALRGFEPCRVSAANAAHTILCAISASALERAYPDQRVMGEHELRREERLRGRPLASAWVGRDASLHRPDLVLWPAGADERLPVAVEVELTVKAPQRLLEICRAWARCECVAGTLYLAPADVRRALARATERAHAGERIAVVGLDALGDCAGASGDSLTSTVPGDA